MTLREFLTTNGIKLPEKSEVKLGMSISEKYYSKSQKRLKKKVDYCIMPVNDYPGPWLDQNKDFIIQNLIQFNEPTQ